MRAMLRMMILMIIIKNPDTIIELFLTQLINIIAELIYFFVTRCEWIRSERFAKKLREEAQKREKNNPMKAGRQLSNQDCHAIAKYRKYWTLYWKYFPFEKKNNLIQPTENPFTFSRWSVPCIQLPNRLCSCFLSFSFLQR